MKHILFVNDLPFNPQLGGIERVTDTVTRGLVARGYKVSYLCGKVSDAKALDYDFPATLFQLPQPELFSNEENITYYNRLLVEQKIDIVINQRGLNSYMNPLLENSSAKRISVVHSKPTTIVDYEIWRILRRKPGFAGEVKYWLRRLFYRPLRYFTTKRYNEIVRRQMEYIVQHGEAAVMLCNRYVDDVRALGVEQQDGDGRLLAIYNPNTFDNIVDSVEKQKEILFVGRVETYQKNILRLIEIWQRLYVDFPDWKLVIVGDGPMLPEIKRIVEQNNIERVELEGRQLNVRYYYQKASIVCLTSNFEGWPMTMIEGMQCGCVPFSFNTYGAAEEIIDHEQCGMIIEPDNIEQYAARLAEVMSDDVKREAMSAAARKKTQQWTSDIVIEQWIKLIESL